MPRAYDYFMKHVQEKKLKQYIWILRTFAFIYIMVGAVFFLIPDTLLETINSAGQMIAMSNNTFTHWIGGPSPLPNERFYVVLTTAMMAMLTVTAFLGSLNPKTTGYLFIHLTSKAVSICGFFYYFFEKQQFPYLVGALTDAWVFLVIALFYLRTRRVSVA